MTPRTIVGFVLLPLLGSCASPLIVERQVQTAPPPQVVIVPQAQPIIIKSDSSPVDIETAAQARAWELYQAHLRSQPAATVRPPEIRYIGCKTDYVAPIRKPPPTLSAEEFSKIPRDKPAEMQESLLKQIEKLDKWIRENNAEYDKAYTAYRKSCGK